jgi:hypothetical protein
VTKNSASTTTDSWSYTYDNAGTARRASADGVALAAPGGTSRGAAYMCIFAGTAALLSEYPFVGIMF